MYRVNIFIKKKKKKKKKKKWIVQSSTVHPVYSTHCMSVILIIVIVLLSPDVPCDLSVCLCTNVSHIPLTPPPTNY